MSTNQVAMLVEVAKPEPLAAQVIEAPPSPFRFGLKALMVLMAICGVQFALMYYIGILLGLVAGLVSCFVVLGGLMVSAMMFWRGEGSRLMHRLDQLAIRLVVAIVLLALGSVFAGGGLAIYQEVAAWRKVSKLQKELGFTADSKTINLDNTRTGWGLVITDITPGGALDQAGAVPSDVIICEKDPERFYEMLEEHRGEEISLTVAPNADMQPLSTCVARKIDVSVPR